MLGTRLGMDRQPLPSLPGFLRDPYKEYSEPWFGTTRCCAAAASPRRRARRACASATSTRLIAPTSSAVSARARGGRYHFEGKPEGEALDPNWRATRATGGRRAGAARRSAPGAGCAAAPAEAVAVLVTEPVGPEVIAVLGRQMHPVVSGRACFAASSEADNPPGVAAEIAIPANPKGAATWCFLEGVQDPGNVGAILRSAAAFGIGARGARPRPAPIPGRRGRCAPAWAGILRSGIADTDDLAAEIEAFKGTVACTVPRGGIALADAPLDRGTAWIFGAEGSGLSEETIRRADVRVTIPMAPGTESINVAAAAAICLYQGFSRSAG